MCNQNPLCDINVITDPYPNPDAGLVNPFLLREAPGMGALYGYYRCLLRNSAREDNTKWF